MLLSGLAGSNDLENAEIWGIIDSVNDKFKELEKIYYEKDEARKVSTSTVLYVQIDSVHNITFTTW